MGDHGRRCFDRFRIDRASACAHRLADTTEVTIRMLCPEDRESFLAGFEGLSRELADVARERGIRRFRADVIGANHAVRALVHELDANVTPAAVDGNIAVYDLEVAADGVEAPLRQQPVSDA